MTRKAFFESDGVIEEHVLTRWARTFEDLVPSRRRSTFNLQRHYILLFIIPNNHHSHKKTSNSDILSTMVQRKSKRKQAIAKKEEVGATARVCAHGDIGDNGTPKDGLARLPLEILSLIGDAVCLSRVWGRFRMEWGRMVE